jgi:hypothetical protein
MEYSQAIKNLKTNIQKIKEGVEILDKNSSRKSISFIQEFTQNIKELESNAKKLKLDLKGIGIESKQIEKELKDAKGVLTHQDFSDLLSKELIASNPTYKELALLLVLEKPVIELKGIIAKKIKSKYLPIESWSEENIFKEFADTSKYPTNKDIFFKLPKEYKPKSLPKKREDVIKKLVEVVNKTRSGYIMEKV